MKHILTHLLNPSTGTEADIWVGMTLHHTVVVAVCLREHRQRDLKYKTGRVEPVLKKNMWGLTTVQHHQSWRITLKFKQINSGGIVFCRVSRRHSHSSPKANDGWNVCSFTFLCTIFACRCVPRYPVSWTTCQAAAASTESELNHVYWTRPGSKRVGRKCLVYCENSLSATTGLTCSGEVWPTASLPPCSGKQGNVSFPLRFHWHLI